MAMKKPSFLFSSSTLIIRSISLSSLSSTPILATPTSSLTSVNAQLFSSNYILQSSLWVASHKHNPSSHLANPLALTKLQYCSSSSTSTISKNSHSTSRPPLYRPPISVHRNTWHSHKLPRLVYPPLHPSVYNDESDQNQQLGSSDLEDNKSESMHVAHQLLHLVQVESLKQKFKRDGCEIISYQQFLCACHETGLCSSLDEGEKIAKSLNDAGTILIFQNVVYLNPKKVAQLLISAIPKPPSFEEDQSVLQEVSNLEQQQNQIDTLAHKHSRRVLWLGFGYFTLQTALIFRLTFWELSWDVMEPIAYFVTTFNMLIGYIFFMLTSRDPTYQDIGKALFDSKKKKLMKKKNFDIARFLSEKKNCKLSTLLQGRVLSSVPLSLN